jgi:hypothetical protein
MRAAFVLATPADARSQAARPPSAAAGLTRGDRRPGRSAPACVPRARRSAAPGRPGPLYQFARPPAATAAGGRGRAAPPGRGPGRAPHPTPAAAPCQGKRPRPPQPLLSLSKCRQLGGASRPTPPPCPTGPPVLANGPKLASTPPRAATGCGRRPRSARSLAALARARRLVAALQAGPASPARGRHTGRSAYRRPPRCRPPARQRAWAKQPPDRPRLQAVWLTSGCRSTLPFRRLQAPRHPGRRAALLPDAPACKMPWLCSVPAPVLIGPPCDRR